MSIKSPTKAKPATPASVISLFAGCGGLDLGFNGGFTFKGERYGPSSFNVLMAYDNNHRCAETYRLNIENNIVECDLSDVDITELPTAEVLIGGFPCQDFSSCGPKKGLTSSRGQLYRVLVDYMAYHKPFVVVAENVPHLARMSKGAVLDVILEDFREPGYCFEVWSLFAPDYGVPQNRTRLFLVGVRDDLEGRPGVPKTNHSGKHRSIDWAISDLEKVQDESVPNQSQYFKASKAKRGNGQGDEVSIAGQPAYTVRANAKSRVQFHYKLPRRLTVRECARLQTFPDNFVFPHSATTNVMQIGNAVPPLLAYHVAKSIEDYLSTLRP